MALTLTGVHELSAGLLTCVCAALEEAAASVEGQPGCPCRSCVIPGSPAWDECTDPCGEKTGGQLTVHVVRLAPVESSSQTTRQRDALTCAPPPSTQAELAVTLLRCAPTVNDLGCPPSCEEMEAAARVLHVDQVTVYRALLCCLPELTGSRRTKKFSVGQSSVRGPEGGCVGLEQRVTVTLPGMCCPSEQSPS